MDFTTIFAQNISQCEDIIGYVFNSKAFCSEALNAAGPLVCRAPDGTLRGVPTNTRLAVFGRSIADSHLCGSWFDSGLSRGQ